MIVIHRSSTTVEPLLTHTPRWMAQAIGYKRIWGMKGQFWCKFEFCSSQKVWVKRVYGLREVRLSSKGPKGLKDFFPS